MSHFGKKKVLKKSGSPASQAEIDAFLKKVRSNISEKEADYRRRSLAIHPHVCAKCGREFNESNLQLLTVHHKDGNHQNNPPDGSNWENLCVFCHEDEHARGVLADYISECVEENAPPENSEPGGVGFGTLKAALSKHLNQKK